MMDILTRYYKSVQAELPDNSELQISVIRAIYCAISGKAVTALLDATWEFIGVDRLVVVYDCEAWICHAANHAALDEFVRSLYDITGLDCLLVTGSDGLWRVTRQGDRWITESLSGEVA